jgi:hypothetical protein
MKLCSWLKGIAPLMSLVLLLSGCGTFHRHSIAQAQLRAYNSANSWTLSPQVENQILALDPGHVTGKDIEEVLAHAPAPRMICFHGGVPFVIPIMVSFCDFLAGMGYPRQSLTNPADGTYTYSCYESSEMIAGMMGWYYEHEGLRPMMVGHSQGGMQVVKVLYDFSPHAKGKVPVWNPLTWEKENRYEITDPLTGQRRSLTGFQVPYATSLVAGGLTRFMPNQLDMAFHLRAIPDSVEEFTGFYKGGDILGGDFLGYGSMNHFRAAKNASVRNVELPTSWSHYTIPNTRHLVKSQAIRDRINDYTPDKLLALKDPANSDPETLHMMWAQDVWYSIKRHWVLELQRLIAARRSGATIGTPAKAPEAPDNRAKAGNGD